VNDYYDDKLTFLVGDCLDRLKDLPDKSVQMVVTSPPYFGLRDYGMEEQIGHETTPEEFVNAMVQVLRAIRRVLRDDGTVWLNLGDSYAVNGGARTYGSTDDAVGRGSAPGGPRRAPTGFKPKDLLGIPWMVAFALRNDGWFLRSDIIWAKSNPMPESVKDRPTTSHEYIFLLTKSSDYYYDTEAIKEPAKSASSEPLPPRNKRDVWEIASRPFKGAHFAVFPPALVEPCVLAGTSERGCCPICGAPWRREVERYEGPSKVATWTKTVGWLPSCMHYDRGDEWPQLPKRERGESDDAYYKRISSERALRAELLDYWATLPIDPCVVLDPFGGSGTTALVAEQYGRRTILIELNPEYVEIALNRLSRGSGTSAAISKTVEDDTDSE
jgi:DNA modification methylase